MSHSLELIRDQILVLVAKDFKLKYNSTMLGFLWSILTPICQSIVYYFVFRVIIRFEVDHYLLFLLSGMFLWQFFCNTVLVSGNVFWGNASLIKKTVLPRSLLVVGVMITEFLHFLLTIPILLLIMRWDAIPCGVSFFLLPVALLNLGLFTLGFSFLYATINMFFRDMERILNVFLQMWMFLTPVMIPMSVVPPQYHIYFKLNPMFYMLNFWRDIFYQPQICWMNICLSFIVGLALFLFGYFIFTTKEPVFSEMM